MIKSLVKAFEILQLFNSAEPRLTLAQISERLGYHKSTTYNLLATLLELGYVGSPTRISMRSALPLSGSRSRSA